MASHTRSKTPSARVRVQPAARHLAFQSIARVRFGASGQAGQELGREGVVSLLGQRDAWIRRVSIALAQPLCEGRRSTELMEDLPVFAQGAEFARAAGM